ncbi:hypothetical protein BGZ65_005482, partial [Modicella reniformis]
SPYGFPFFLDRVKNKPDVEGNLCQLRGDVVYIQPQAKASLRAYDKARLRLNNDNDPDEQPTQSFRNRLTGKVAEIPTEIDPKSGKRIVLWDDIQNAFQNAGSIWNAKSLVPLMKDNPKPLIPERIPYHPKVVLDVVVKTTEQTISTREDVRLPQIQSARNESKNHDDRLNQTLATLAIADNTNQSLVVYPEGIPHGTQSSILERIDQMEKRMDEKFDKTNLMQQQTLDQLAVIHNRVEAAITQTYELHEYPIPRLFIVLPNWRRV